MTRNFHTHTFRCNHASGSDRDYVETAIKNGFKVLGFSDHNPIVKFGDSDYYSGFRMRPAQLPDYVESILALKEEYKRDIDILLGFEMEYYPALFEDTLAFLGQYPYDYLIQGQHFLGNEVGEPPVSREATDEESIVRYVEQVCEGMRTGAFSYLAHPDIFHFTGDDAVYRRQMRKICETANEMDIPLECNLLGVRDERRYPSERFFRLAADYNCKVILGCDAHQPTALIDPKNDRAYAFLKTCGVTNIVEDISLKGE